MLSSLFRPFRGNKSRVEEETDPEQEILFQPSVSEYRRHLHATADFTEADDDDEESRDGEQSHPEQGEDGPARSTGLLPRFSAHHLESLPIYSITHAIRVIVQARTETALTWEQLRAPQVSQFLVKPMQQQIRAQHFSPGTLYALMANCLQFEKESQLYPGSAGTSDTRAKVCELLAIKLLKEYSTRELIDALCYDFNPLQGIPGAQTVFVRGSRPETGVPRTSALEVAIRASAKQFLSHPLVVQQLEAIWNGAISFAPNREEPQRQGPPASAAASGSNASRRQSTVRSPLLGDQRAKEASAQSQHPPARLSVSLYDPRTATPLKLSRLRVPRYRRILSTCSLVVLISLFLAVLGRRSSTITSLELLFWFWSAGFVLDELVGFSEQGFSFYVMSFWNIFDLGILLLLIVYYCMRIYGVFLLDPHKWNQNAYDVLALNAILLLPRVYGLLDHSRYFSRLLIALRLLAIDLAAVFILVLICCSGFFVFFLSSKGGDDPWALAYKLFQILVGFTPSAWDLWPTYGSMGKTLMGLFLVMSQFIISTMFVTTLTTSFISIAARANQEYQFAFAINTMSMAKNDALFSYIAPGNIFAWALMPLRYCMSQDRYVWLNRAVIKASHFPPLFCIYLYERCFLAPDMYEATDLVDKPRRGRQPGFTNPASTSAFFSPSIRVREESVIGYQKDRALEEVFRRGPDTRTHRRNDRRKTQTAVRSWMDQNDSNYRSPQNYSTIGSRMSSDWLRRLSMNRERPSRFPRHYSDIRSAASDPADFISDAPYPIASEMYAYNDGIARRDYAFEVKENTDGDADGDDELVTNDEDEEDNATNAMTDRPMTGEDVIEEDYFTTPVATRFMHVEPSAVSPRPATSRRVPLHTRTMSTNTILYAPAEDPNHPYSSSSASAWPTTTSRPFSRPLSTRHTPVATPITRAAAAAAADTGGGRRSPRRSLYLASRPRSMIQPGEAIPRNHHHNHHNHHNHRTAAGLTLDIPTASTTPLMTTTTAAAGMTPRLQQQPARRRSLADLDALVGGDIDNDIDNNAPSTDSSGRRRLNRLMLARMRALEASLGDVVREMRELRRVGVGLPGGLGLQEGDGDGEGGEGGVGQDVDEDGEGDERGGGEDGDGRRRQPQLASGRGGVLRVGSDPSSAAYLLPREAGLVEVEVAVGGRERRAAAGAGSRRPARVAAGAATVTTTTPRRIGSGRRQGAWRSSPKEGRGEAGAAAGLGIAGSRMAKGKERERVPGGGVDVGEGEAVGGSLGMSPAQDELGISGRRIPL